MSKDLAIAYSVARKNKRKMAKGGMLEKDESDLESSASPASPDEQPKSEYDESKEEMMERHRMEMSRFAEGGMIESGSIAESIMRKRRGDDPGVADIEDNALEGPAEDTEQNFEANGKELYDDDQLSDQPLDSIGDEREDSEENEHDRSLVGQIRSKMKKKL